MSVQTSDSSPFEARAARLGFSRVDLLAVIATIAVLAGLLFVVIHLAHARVQMAYCKNNNRQLCRAWLMYAEANQSLVNNFGRDEMRAEYLSGDFSNWVNGVLDWGSGEQNTNLAYINNGLLYPYAHNPRIYRCPADNFASPVQRRLGWRRRTRSFSMNGFLGRFFLHGVDATANGRNPFISEDRQFVRLSDIPHPATTYVFIEEQADTLGDAYFWVNNDGWADIPGAYHAHRSDLSYADGHCEFHRWHSPQTLIPVKYQIEPHWHPTNPDGEAELQWLLQHATVSAQQ
jgi:hypothetical protein